MDCKTFNWKSKLCMTLSSACYFPCFTFASIIVAVGTTLNILRYKTAFLLRFEPITYPKFRIGSIVLYQNWGCATSIKGALFKGVDRRQKMSKPSRAICEASLKRRTQSVIKILSFRQEKLSTLHNRNMKLTQTVRRFPGWIGRHVTTALPTDRQTHRYVE